MADFLLEIGLEEVPARMLAAAQQELVRRVRALIERERLFADGAGEVTGYSTPRRLAVLATGLRSKQEDSEEQLQGPAAKVAFKDGQPTPAAIAFAKKAGVDVSELKTQTTAKGEYVTATLRKLGRYAADVLARELPPEIAGIYWAKSMYWRPGKPERFVRPVRWLVALLDETVVPLEFAGIHAGADSYGHRILHGAAPVRIAKPTEYAETLEKAYVVVDPEQRRNKIRKALDAATRTVAGMRWREDEALVDQTVHLTEWPSVVLGGFEREHLSLPEEVLVTVMRDHQKYFAVEDAHGKLAPYFLAVLNTEVDEDGAEIIRHGNARVLRARFNDARFFWETDQKILLEQRVEMLKAVTFQKQLGSYWDKTQANMRVARALLKILNTKGARVNGPDVELALKLAKTDLTTELVKEFTELQGIVGGLYAAAQGMPPAVAQAIYEQYMPAGMEDAVPRTAEAALVGIADRADTIVDMFAIGLSPTGSKDPFALRRAGNGIVRILAGDGDAAPAVPLTLADVVEAATGASAQKQAGEKQPEVLAFLRERLTFYLRDAMGFAYDVVNAVMAADADDVRDGVARARAVAAVRGTADFAAISTAFKRMKNILAQADSKGETAGVSVNSVLLTPGAEAALHAQLLKLAPEVEALRRSGDYAVALDKIATLRPPVDAFFDAVMVLAPEPELRANRLALLQLLLADFSRIADFSEIVPAD
jgi:glycyl-tRNA synthetase beta chain